MSKFELKTFNDLIQNFFKIKKRILKNRPLSTKESKVNEYVELLIENYNAILSYTSLHKESSIASEGYVPEKILHCREILVRCFGKLGCKIRVPHDISLFELVDREILTEPESGSESTELGNESDSSEEEDSEEIVKENTGGIKRKAKFEITMATVEQKRSFISMCANILRENYDGNPLSLQSFFDKIDLIQDLTDANLTVTLVSFVKSKLEGKAREALPENVSTIDQIKTALKNKIKPDNSKVVAGKIAALQVRNNNYADFAKQSEELADALERSLVIEGITKDKAHEMAIEQTINVCRLNARSDLVKSILASTSFSDPKDVVAKLVVEQTNETKEKQVLAFQYQGNNVNSFSNRNNFNHFNNNRGNNFNRFSNNRGYNRGNGYSRGFNQNRGGNFNRNAFNNNFNRTNYRYNNNNRNNSNNRNARALPLNAEAPQQEMLGEEN